MPISLLKQHRYIDRGPSRYCTMLLMWTTKKGERNVSAMLKWGPKGFGVVSTQELEVLAILKGGCKKFPPLKKEMCVCA